MKQQLNEETKVIRVINATAAGSTPINGTVIDMQNWDGVRFIAALGALTATQVTNLKAQQGAAANGSDAADIVGAVTGNAADGDSNKVLLLDVCEPTGRYVRCVLGRATALAVVDGVTAEQYRGRTSGFAQDATVSQVKTLKAP